eukprot:COSAG06_NODE_3753_length_4945_cov_3.399092_3_plen_226_part_00
MISFLYINGSKRGVFRTQVFVSEDLMTPSATICVIAPCKVVALFLSAAFPMFVPSLSWQNDRFSINKWLKKRRFFAEVNGSVASAVYQMGDPNNLLFGKHGESLEPIPVPPEFLVVEGSPRDPTQGVPSAVFRYDIVYELTSAIVRATKKNKRRRTFGATFWRAMFFLVKQNRSCFPKPGSGQGQGKRTLTHAAVPFCSQVEDRPAVPSFKEVRKTRLSWSHILC